MPQPTYLANDVWKRATDLAFQNRAQEDIHKLTWPSMVQDGIDQITKLGQSIMPQPPQPLDVEPLQAPEPLPIVISDRPEMPDQQAQQPRAVTTPAAPEVAAPAPLSAPGLAGNAPVREEDPGDLEAWTRQEAIRLGIDPDMAVRVANTEGGFADPVRQNMQGAPAYGPYQLYIGGAENPGLGDEAIRRGIDPRNPRHARAGVTLALEHARQSGWGAFQGAAANGIGQWDGIGGRPQSAAPAQAAPQASGQPGGAPQVAQQSSGAPVWGTYTPETLTPNQDTEGRGQGLTAEEALAVCGPAAAVAFARANGRNPTLREAKELAQSLGLWDVGNGMHGPASQVQLLEKMGIKARLQEGADWAAIAQEVQAGRPVIVDTPNHYFTVTGYDPRTGEFEFGQSAGVLRRSGGKTRWRPEDLPQLGMGSPRATIYMGGR